MGSNSCHDDVAKFETQHTICRMPNEQLCALVLCVHKVNIQNLVDGHASKCDEGSSGRRTRDRSLRSQYRHERCCCMAVHHFLPPCDFCCDTVRARVACFFFSLDGIPMLATTAGQSRPLVGTLATATRSQDLDVLLRGERPLSATKTSLDLYQHSWFVQGQGGDSHRNGSTDFLQIRTCDPEEIDQWQLVLGMILMVVWSVFTSGRSSLHRRSSVFGRVRWFKDGSG